MAAIGQVVTAPWGRYEVHRMDGDRAVLRDLARPGAFVLPTRAELAASYELEVAARPDPTPLKLVHEPLQLVQRDAGQDRGRPRDRAHDARPSPAPAAPVGRQVCAGCERPRVVLAYIGEVGYCWRCYGVSEVPRTLPAVAAIAARSAAQPEDESTAKAELGSFDSPPVGERRPRTWSAPRPARVNGDDWQHATGGAPR